MALIRNLALRVPAIRRLVEGRDVLLVQLEAAVTALAASRAREESVRSSPTPPSQEWPLALKSELDVLRGAYESLEKDTAEMRLARSENRLFLTEYPYFPSSRPIEQASGGRRLEAMFRQSESAIEQTVRGIARHIDALARIPRVADGSLSPFWENGWFPPFDGAALYGLIGENKPRRYIEVGSGISTRFARQAITDLGLTTRIVSIDPHPHNALKGLCDETIVSRMEDLPAQFWDGLSAGDMVFIDNSHRSFPGSDVTVFFSEVLPALPAHVIYGIHDIFLPFDYPAEWNSRFYNEQYLLLTYLLGGAAGDQVILPVAWTCAQGSLHGLLSELWQHSARFEGLSTHGGAFWARRSAPSATIHD